MKIPRERLEQIVKEELAKHISGLLSEGPSKPATVSDAEDDNTEKDSQEKAGAEKGKKAEKPPKADPKKDKAKAPPELPVGKEPADDKLDDPSGGSDEDTEDAADVTGGEIASSLEGKTVQSIVLEPKSKVLPGSQEIVISFSQTPEPLRILVNKSGVIKFMYQGGLHNKL